MKKVRSLGIVILLLVSMMILPAQASSNTYQEIETLHTEFGDFEIKTVTIVHNSAARSSSKSADRIRTVTNNGSVIAEITLSATFGYNGSSAWVTSASGSHTTYSGWSYGNENITTSGGTATLTATLSKLLDRVSVNISLTCSPTGQIS